MPEILALKYGNFEKDTWLLSNDKRLNDQRKKPLGGETQRPLNLHWVMDD